MEISRLKIERIRRNLNKHQLAYELKVPWEMIQLWESEALKPNVQQKKQISDFFRIYDEKYQKMETITNPDFIKDIVEKTLKTLTEREARILRMRFGLKDRNRHTLREVAKQFNVSFERIRQIEAKALRKLKFPNRNYELNRIINDLNLYRELFFAIFGRARFCEECWYIKHFEK
jgi:RNA polymerase primary sigma factor